MIKLNKSINQWKFFYYTVHRYHVIDRINQELKR
jgi:hypothetical protein